MLDIKQIENIVLDQMSSFRAKESGINREVDFTRFLRTEQITVISGIRRSGKSTLLRQFSEKLENFYYINFDDERLINFKVEDFNNLLIVWQKQFTSRTVLLDEIQNIPAWERFVRRIHDEGFKVFVTGSNAKLLSSELATHLTGRYFKLELYPFSFPEILSWHGLEKKEKLTTKNKAWALKVFDAYLKSGGFPEYLKSQDGEFLQRTYSDIVYKDIIARFGIREIKSFRQLATYLFTNFTGEINYNALSKILNIKSAISVKNYIGFLEESYLVFELHQYDYSLKKQLAANKKIYVIDNGMRNKVAFSFSENRGRLLENLVFLELRRREREAYFYRDKKECDFIIAEKNKIVGALQVAQKIDATNEKREVDGLLAALETFNLRTGTILTESEERTQKIGKKIINFIPVWQWLLTDGAAEKVV